MSEEMKDVRELLQRLVTNQELHALEQRNMKEDIEQIKCILIEGNGRPAMTVQVATIDQRLRSLEMKEEDRKVPRSVSIGIVVSLVLGVASILAGFVNV
jgi:hypothetical protein